MDLKQYIASIPGFPKEGIIFRDVTPILADADAMQYCIDEFATFGEKVGADVVLGPEARGFLFGTPVALKNHIGFVPVRKPGKLPRKTISASYELEYGENVLSIHEDDLKPGSKVLVVDDLLATGGTTCAIIDLCKRLGCEVVGCAFVIELDDLNGKDNFKDIPLLSLVHYEGE